MKPAISIAEVARHIGDLPLPEVDAVVAIERGGLAAGEILASMLDRPLVRFRLSYRDDANDPLFDEPQIVEAAQIPVSPGGHLLVVDDVSVSGATLQRARDHLAGYRISTLVLKGSADLVAFPEIEGCVTWPWTPAA